MDLAMWQLLLRCRELLEFYTAFPRLWSETKKAKGFELIKHAQGSECKGASALVIQPGFQTSDTVVTREW